jgi:hypothetical protein
VAADASLRNTQSVELIQKLLRAPKMVKQTRDDKIAKDKDNIYNYCKDSASSKAKKMKIIRLLGSTPNTEE